MNISEWVRINMQEHGEAWCYANAQQCFLDCNTSSNTETFSRTVRKIRAELGGKNVNKPEEVATIHDAIAYHDVDMASLELRGVKVNTWGNGLNKSQQVKLDLKPRVDPILDHKKIIEDFRAEVRAYKPVARKIKRENYKESFMYEIALPDLHAAMLAWAVETGQYDYDLSIFAGALVSNVDRLLQRVNGFPLDQIVLALNGDMFNSNGITMATVGGTPQHDDSRFHKTFSLVWRVMRDTVLFCKEFADVKVIITQGNHEGANAYYLGEVLQAWFENDDHVIIDNIPRIYKYHQYGQSLLGVTHGHGAKIDKLPGIMATDIPALWGATKFREYHIGHFHNEQAMEFPGCTVRVCKAMSPASEWTVMKGYRSIPATQGFLWSKSEGQIAVNTVNSF